MQINEPAPDFELRSLQGQPVRLSDFRGRIVILDFWSCECPHSERTDRALSAMLVQWAEEVVMLAVASNHSESLECIRESARVRRLSTILLDADHVVADLYGAQTTPHVFVIDRQGILRYRGAVDDVTFRHRQPERFFLDEAVEALLDGRLPSQAETPAYGCSIVREG